MPQKDIIKQTKKRKDTIILPGATEIYQSNRITNARFRGFNNLHTKILIHTIKQLQDAIKMSMSGGDWRQMDMFNNNSEGVYRIPLYLSEIDRPDKYKDVVQAGMELQTLQVKLKSTIDNKVFNTRAGLFARWHEPIKVNGKSVVYIDILKDVAAEIIEIDKRLDGKPVLFTKYLYEVAMSSRSKYTAKMYMILSSWKTKGGFRITLNELRQQLGIEENEYVEFKNFKTRILIPVQKDLEKKSDCWFNCRMADFEVRENRKVIALNFKIITPEFEKESQKKIDYIRNLLHMHFGFENSHLRHIAPIFDNFTIDRYNAICEKIMDLKRAIDQSKGTKSAIHDVASYMSTSLLNEFSC